MKWFTSVLYIHQISSMQIMQWVYPTNFVGLAMQMENVQVPRRGYPQLKWGYPRQRTYTLHIYFWVHG